MSRVAGSRGIAREATIACVSSSPGRTHCDRLDCFLRCGQDGGMSYPFRATRVSVVAAVDARLHHDRVLGTFALANRGLPCNWRGLGAAG